MSRHPTVEFPFGWEQGDPLVVCHNPQHMDYVVRAFKFRAHYILPLAMVAGRRYNKIIVFQPVMFGDYERQSFERWLNELRATKLGIGGEFYLV